MKWYNNPYVRVYGDGEGDGSGGGDGTGGDGSGSSSGNDNGKFTPEQQKKVDEIINKRLAREKKEKESLITELNSLRQSQSLTAEERETLSKRVEELENSIMTESEKAVKERSRLEREHKTKLDQALTEGSTWKKRFEDSTIERAITDAAVSLDAQNPLQLRMMFSGSTRLIEEKGEDGKPTGNFVPMMKFLGKEDDKTVEFDLPVADALKKIKEDGFNANLFKHSGTGGTGRQPSGQNSGSGHTDPSVRPEPEMFNNDMVKWRKAYHKWRDEYNSDGTKRKKP